MIYFQKKDENIPNKVTECSLILKFYPKKCDETISYYRVQYKQGENAPENAMKAV